MTLTNVVLGRDQISQQSESIRDGGRVKIRFDQYSNSVPPNPDYDEDEDEDEEEDEDDDYDAASAHRDESTVYNEPQTISIPMSLPPISIPLKPPTTPYFSFADHTTTNS